MKRTLMYIVSILGGISLWMIVSKVSGEPMAWDSPLYFQIGFPVFLVLMFVVGLIIPRRPWRWSVAGTMAQIIPLMIATGTDYKAWLFGLLFLAILAIPASIATFIGSFIGKKYFYPIEKRV